MPGQERPDATMSCPVKSHYDDCETQAVCPRKLKVGGASGEYENALKSQNFVRLPRKAAQCGAALRVLAATHCAGRSSPDAATCGYVRLCAAYADLENRGEERRSGLGNCDFLRHLYATVPPFLTFLRHFRLFTPFCGARSICKSDAGRKADGACKNGAFGSHQLASAHIGSHQLGYPPPRGGSSRCQGSGFKAGHGSGIIFTGRGGGGLKRRACDRIGRDLV